MFRHVVLMKWKDEATDAQREAVVAALRELPALIPELKNYVVGADAGMYEGNFNMAVVADFDDVEGYLVYRDQARHQEIIRDLISPILEARSAVQHDV